MNNPSIQRTTGRTIFSLRLSCLTENSINKNSAMQPHKRYSLRKEKETRSSKTNSVFLKAAAILLLLRSFFCALTKLPGARAFTRPPAIAIMKSANIPRFIFLFVSQSFRIRHNSAAFRNAVIISTPPAAHAARIHDIMRFFAE